MVSNVVTDDIIMLHSLRTKILFLRFYCCQGFISTVYVLNIFPSTSFSTGCISNRTKSVFPSTIQYRIGACECRRRGRSRGGSGWRCDEGREGQTQLQWPWLKHCTSWPQSYWGNRCHFWKGPWELSQSTEKQIRGQLRSPVRGHDNLLPQFFRWFSSHWEHTWWSSGNVLPGFSAVYESGCWWCDVDLECGRWAPCPVGRTWTCYSMIKTFKFILW